jgi:tRNA (Thr-GGU) A37 N-methylase
MSEEKIQCSQCNQLADPSKAIYIDKIPFCSACLYGDLKPFEIYPVGFVRNNLDRELDREFGLVGNPREESRIELLPSQKTFMYKLEEEEFLTIVYYFHKHKPPRSKFRRKYDLKEVGIFASRSPDRLSRIAVTDVKLVKIEGMTLFVTGLDAISGTPVLDIKMSLRVQKRDQP